VLTGKYDPDKAPAKGTRAGRRDKRMMETEFRRESILAAREIAAHAEANGTDPIAFAVQWVLNNQIVDSVLAGPRTLAHWKGYLKAMDYVFTADDEALIDNLVPAGHPSTPGYTDPRYPLTGRPTWTGGQG
jgi:aryl-alcohol dehydrogenase-like predicted oxidoreductase